MDTYERPLEPLTFEKVWFMFQETAKRFQETDRKFQETAKRFQETDIKFQETDKQFKETDKKLNKLEHLFTSQWGKLIESLVAGDLIKLLNKKGIEVHYLNTRISGIYNKRQFEFDIIAQNDNETVVVEVKTTLKPDDIKDFIEDLKQIKQMMPIYKDKKVIGAVAYLQADGDAQKMAEKNGLFIIKATGSSASIVNSEGFSPKLW